MPGVNTYMTSRLCLNFLIYFFLLLLKNYSALHVLVSNLCMYKNTVFDCYVSYVSFLSVCTSIHTSVDLVYDHISDVSYKGSNNTNLHQSVLVQHKSSWHHTVYHVPYPLLEVHGRTCVQLVSETVTVKPSVIHMPICRCYSSSVSVSVA